jgi:hypothetical protein
MPLYFAYGSNMSLAPMKARCPASKPLGPARLMRHRFLVNADGYATVLRDPRRAVWGLLWDLALADVPALDRYESVHTNLYAKTVQPVLTESGPRRALIYLARRHQPGEPRPGYMEEILASAREAGLPAAYLVELESWLAGERKAVQPTPAGQPKVRPRFAAPPSIRRSR